MRVHDGSAIFTVQSHLNCGTHGSTLISNKNVTIRHISDFLSRYSSPGKWILTRTHKMWRPGHQKLVWTVLRKFFRVWNVTAAVNKRDLTRAWYLAYVRSNSFYSDNLNPNPLSQSQPVSVIWFCSEARCWHISYMWQRRRSHQYASILLCVWVRANSVAVHVGGIPEVPALQWHARGSRLSCISPR